MNQEFAMVTMALFEGFIMTVKIFSLTLLFALPLGLIMSFGSMSKFAPLKALVKILVDTFLHYSSMVILYPVYLLNKHMQTANHV